MRSATDLEYQTLLDSMRNDLPEVVKKFMEQNPDALQAGDEIAAISFYPVRWSREKNQDGVDCLLIEAELVCYAPMKNGQVMKQLVATLKVHRPNPTPLILVPNKQIIS